MILKSGTFSRLVLANDDGGGTGPPPPPPPPPPTDNKRVETRKEAPEDIEKPDFTGGDGYSTDSDSRISDVIQRDKTIGGNIKGKLVNTKRHTKGKRHLTKDIQDKWKKRAQAVLRDKKVMADLSDIARSTLQAWEHTAPVIDWRYILKNFFTKAKKKKKWVNPKRRFVSKKKYIYGQKKDDKDTINNVVVAMDTSGSVSKDQIQVFTNEIMGIIKLVNVEKMTIIYMSDSIDGVDTFSPIKGEKPDMSKYGSTGGNAGGFIPPFKHVADMGIIPDLFLYMTDGHADYPDVGMFNIRSYTSKIIWFIVRNQKGFGFGPDGKKQTIDTDVIRDLPPFGDMMLYSVKDFMRGSKGYNEEDYAP